MRLRQSFLDSKTSGRGRSRDVGSGRKGRLSCLGAVQDGNVYVPYGHGQYIASPEVDMAAEQVQAVQPPEVGARRHGDVTAVGAGHTGCDGLTPQQPVNSGLRNDQEAITVSIRQQERRML